jgi:hypothetical protein
MTNNLEHHIFQPVDTDWTGQISALIDLDELTVLKVHEQGMDGPPRGWKATPKFFRTKVSRKRLLDLLNDLRTKPAE